MKKCKGLFMLALLACAGLQAQFTASTVAETIAGNSPNVSKTNTDVKPILLGTTVPYLYVTVWDGGTPGVRWDVPAAGLGGFLPLPAGSIIPDVIISSTAAFTNTWVIAVYRNGANFVITRWQWLGAGFGAPVTNAFLAVGLGASPPSINIDADIAGNYAVVTGQATAAISVYDAANATLPALPVFRSVLAAGTGFQADICIHNTGAGPIRETVSFTNTTSTILSRRTRPFGFGAFGGAVVVAPAVAGVTYADPRIACPQFNPGGACAASDYFSIIFSRITAANYFIQINNVRCGLPPVTATLTSGAFGFPVPAIQFSKRPALSYNRKFSYTSPGFPNEAAVAAAWVTADPGRSIVGERLRTDGTIWPGFLTYYDVPNPTRSNCDLASVSAKYSDDRVFISFYDYSTMNIINKEFSYLVNSMRTTGQEAATELISGKQEVEIFPNPSRSNVQVRFRGIDPLAVMQLKVTDISGKLILNTQNTGSRLQEQVKTWFSGASPGLYMVRFSNEQGFSSLTKLIKE